MRGVALQICRRYATGTLALKVLRQSRQSAFDKPQAAAENRRSKNVSGRKSLY